MICATICAIDRTGGDHMTISLQDIRIDRRRFLAGSAAAVAGGAALAGPFAGYLAGPVAASTAPVLGPVADKRDGVVRLWLPPGFAYRSFHDTEQQVILDDGTVLPGRHDGMAAFKGRHGNTVLVRNHEVNNPVPPFGDPTQAYDTATGGGTTTIEVTGHGEVIRAFTSLNGTQMNCAGGRVPWGSWVTCEETVNGPDVGPDFTGASNVTLTQRHGFLFEVPADGQSDREPITGAGRFAHEAVTWDSDHDVLYLTEDNFAFPSGLYRFIPRESPWKRKRLSKTGRLQMLAVRGMPNVNLAVNQVAGTTYRTRWVDIDDPNPSFPFTPGQTAPTTNDQALVYVGDQGRSQGAAWFSRLEGARYDRGVVYFTSTQGGGAAEGFPDTVQGFGNGFGQVWAYDTSSGRLRVVFQSPGPEVLDFPDNITTSKKGTLVLCEDSTGDNFLRGLTRRGKLFDIALNRLVSSTGTPRFGDEFAGATFSHDGRTMFVNIQASRGLTFAIWGPWGSIGV
jgi:secreted PhoX family phosphatase